MILTKKKFEEIISDNLEMKQDILDLNSKINTLIEQKDLKQELNLKNKQIEELEKKIESQKKATQELASEIKMYGDYKDENEELKNNLKQTEKENDEHLSKIDELKKENKELKNKLDKLDKEGVKIPTRVRKTGITKDTKQTIGIKESKVSNSTKKELKKINELREKEV